MYQCRVSADKIIFGSRIQVNQFSLLERKVVMAIQPKEFIGIAEGIKNHELSMREKIEVLRGEIYELSRSKRTLDRHIARLEASLDAANNKTNQDGDPDYNRIAEIETEIQENQDLQEKEKV